MKKILTFTLLSAALLSGAFAQASDDDLFNDSSFEDDLFMDDGIDQFTATEDARTAEINHGTLFQNGSIKIGGNFDTSITTMTTLYSDDDETFGTHLKDTTLTPTASAYLTVDARPTQTLRMYSKFGLAYPFNSSAVSYGSTSAYTNPLTGDILGYNTSVSTSITDYLKVKELFTDFSIADRAFFRFGLHTVTWGAGYFFSPVSDMINSSSINPEDVDEQVDGSLNLRTQITFPGTQNCLWFYVIPSTDFTSAGSTTAYLRQTALAGKADLVFGNWELGLGGYYKYQAAPKAMVTATGSLKKMSLFGEAVYQYGGDSEWEADTDWSGKTNIFQATAGFSYYWKTPSITLAAQYYYDGNDVDKTYYVENMLSIPEFYQGHNVALLANFGRIFGTTDVTATVFGMANFGREDTYIAPGTSAYLDSLGYSESDLQLTSLICSAMLSYSPTDSLTFSMGPYMTMTDFAEPPVVSLKFTATLGGGKF